MTKLRDDVNEHGTPVSVHRCDWCGDEFTVCPPADGDWGGCQSLDCPSYDPDRDADALFEQDGPRISRRTIH